MQLRPHALRGKAYYDELKAILVRDNEGAQIFAHAIYLMLSKANTEYPDGKLTPADLGYLALYHRLNLKATTEWLEECRLLKCGTYQRLRERGMLTRECFRWANQVYGIEVTP